MVNYQSYGKGKNVETCITVVVELLSHRVFTTMYKSQPKFNYEVDVVAFLSKVREEPWSCVKFRADSRIGQDIAHLGIMVFEKKSE